jgi:MFS family permease
MKSLPADPSLIDSRQAAWRLLATLGLVVLGNSSMYIVSVVLPAVQTEFGVGRADASLPYTLMMICLGLGGLITGRLADRHGLTPVLWVGALAVCGGFIWAGMSGSIWAFGLAHGLMGLIGSSSTFAPLMPTPLCGGTDAAALRWPFAPVAITSRAPFGRRLFNTAWRLWAGGRPTSCWAFFVAWACFCWPC